MGKTAFPDKMDNYWEKIMKNKGTMLATAIAAALVLSACGGGGGGTDTDTASTGSAEGFYTGTTGDDRTLTGAVMANGTYYVMYSHPGLPTTIGGFAQGAGVSNNGSFVSSSGTDFNFEGNGVSPVTVSASYRARSSFSGTISAADGSNTFTATYSTEYEKNPSLITLAGTYNGVIQDVIGGGAATVYISADGNVTGTTSTECSFTGLVAPATVGNAYAVGLTFAGNACLLVGQSLGGAAFYDSTSKTLYSAIFDSARTYGAVFVGTKP
jgi:hypothetical protein